MKPAGDSCCSVIGQWQSPRCSRREHLDFSSRCFVLESCFLHIRMLSFVCRICSYASSVFSGRRCVILFYSVEVPCNFVCSVVTTSLRLYQPLWLCFVVAFSLYLYSKWKIHCQNVALVSVQDKSCTLSVCMTWIITKTVQGAGVWTKTACCLLNALFSVL